MEHTKIPWRFQMLGSEGGRIYPDYGDIRERGKFIAIVNGRNTQEDNLNGDLIVKAVNSYQAMKEALELLLHEPMSERAVDKAKKALTLANGGQTL